MNEFVYRDKRAPGNKGTGGHHGLKNRFREQENGRCRPGTKSWKNHDDEIRGLQNKLKRYAKRYTENCLDSHGPIPKEIDDFATRSRPEKEDWKGDWNKPVPPDCDEKRVRVPRVPPIPIPKAAKSDETPAPSAENSQPAPASKGVDWKAAGIAAAVVVGVVAIGALIVTAPAWVPVAAGAAAVGGLALWLSGSSKGSDGDGA